MNEQADGAVSPSAAPDRRPRPPEEGSGASPLRVAVTRPVTQAGEDRLARLLRSMGANPVMHPLQDRRPPREPGRLEEALDELLRGEGPRWLLVTAPSTVPTIVGALEAMDVTPESLHRAGVQVAAVGSRTGEALARAGLPPDLIPDRFTGDDLLAALVEALVPERARAETGGRPLDGPVVRPVARAQADDGPLAHTHFVLPRAAVARDVLPAGLRQLGARVDVVTAYRVEELSGAGAALVEAVLAGEVDVVALTSGSAARVLGAALDQVVGEERVGARGGEAAWPPNVAVAVIGPVTARAARDAGLPVDLVADPSTLDALARVIVELGRR